MAPIAIKIGDTVHVINFGQLRWFELNDRRTELTLFYSDGTMETLRHRRISDVYNDLLIQFTIIEPDRSS
jgi:hypothetical protein